MNRDELLRLFAIDENDIITTDGPFKGQPLYIAYYWFYYVTGYTEDKTDDIVTFFVRGEDRAQFPQLMERSTVRLKQLLEGKIVEVDAPFVPKPTHDPNTNGDHPA